MRSSEGGEIGLEVLGSGELTGSTGSCFDGGAADSVAAGAPESDAGL